MRVFGPACVSVLLWLPRLKAVVMKPIHYASLHTEKGLFSLCVEEGKHLHCRLCESSLGNHKTRRISSANFTSQIWTSSHLGTFFSWLYFPFLWLSLFYKLSYHHLSLPFPVVVCFLVSLDPLLESSCWVLQRALPHHGNSKLSGWLHHVTKCFMSHSLISHSFHASLSTTASQHSLFCDILFKQRKERKKKDWGINVWWFIDTKTRVA